MNRYEIVPCKRRHAHLMAKILCEEDRHEIAVAGMCPRKLLGQLWLCSGDPKAALIEGQLAAVWGDTAPLMADEGSMWLFTAPIARTMPLAFTAEAKREITARLNYRDALIADVAEDHHRAMRFYRLLGFSFEEPRDMPNGRFRRMRIAREDWRWAGQPQ